MLQCCNLKFGSSSVYVTYIQDTLWTSVNVALNTLVFYKHYSYGLICTAMPTEMCSCSDFYNVLTQ